MLTVACFRCLFFLCIQASFAEDELTSSASCVGEDACSLKLAAESPALMQKIMTQKTIPSETSEPIQQAQSFSGAQLETTQGWFRNGSSIFAHLHSLRLFLLKSVQTSRSSSKYGSTFLLVVLALCILCVVVSGMKKGKWGLFEDKAHASREGQDHLMENRALGARGIQPTSPFPGGIRSPPAILTTLPTNQQRSQAGANSTYLYGSPSPPQGTQRRQISEAALCPELVVPAGQECTLLVPRLPPHSQKDGVNEVTLDDANGVPVFKVTFNMTDRKSHRLTLSQSTTGEVFASLRQYAPAGNVVQQALEIFHGNDQIYGSVRADNQGYSVAKEGAGLRAGNGTQIMFHGDVHSGNLNCTDRDGHLIAIAEPHPSLVGIRLIRVGPGADAGLISLALMGIDVLEHDMSTIELVMNEAA